MVKESSYFTTAVYAILGAIGFAVVCLIVDNDAQTELENSTRTSVYAEVIAKDSYPTLIGKVAVTLHGFVVNVGGEEFDVFVPSNIYDNTEIGDEIEVTVFYKDDKIVRVTCVDLWKKDIENSKSVTGSTL